jgi:hypothetical protein
MKMLYCWRCKADVPMLDEAEYAVVATLYSDSIQATKDYRRKHGLPLDAVPKDLFRPVIEAYERMTGWREANANAIMHHRLSKLGPLCTVCGKPLRTPEAAKCMECGAGVASDTES